MRDTLEFNVWGCGTQHVAFVVSGFCQAAASAAEARLAEARVLGGRCLGLCKGFFWELVLLGGKRYVGILQRWLHEQVRFR